MSRSTCRTQVSAAETESKIMTRTRTTSVIAAALVVWLVATTLALVFLAGRASAQQVCIEWVNPVEGGSTTIYAPDSYASFVLHLADGTSREVGPVTLSQVITAEQPILSATKCGRIVPTPTPVVPTPTPTPEVTPTPTPEVPTPTPTTEEPTVTPTPEEPTPTPERPTVTPTPEEPCDNPETCLPPTGTNLTLSLIGFGSVALGSLLLAWALLRDRLTIAQYLRGRR